jgi:hypothetical protein
MSPSTPARRPWTANERKKLDELLKAGKTVIEIAPVLQRDPPSHLCATTAPRQKTTQAVHPLAERHLRAKGKP